MYYYIVVVVFKYVQVCILTYIITLLSLTLLISRIIILTLLYTCIDIVTYIHMY